MPPFTKRDSWSRTWGARRPHMIFVNEQIKAPTIMIVDEEWNKIWTFWRRRALELAEEKWLDLVQMNYDPQKMQSTVRILDYWKYMYEKQKTEKEKKKQKQSKWFKEIKFNYMIGQNDLDLKVKKTIELLWEWYNVKMIIRLRWRERMYGRKAQEKLMKVVEEFQEFGRVQYNTPKKEAQWYSIALFTKKR